MIWRGRLVIFTWSTCLLAALPRGTLSSAFPCKMVFSKLSLFPLKMCPRNWRYFLLTREGNLPVMFSYWSICSLCPWYTQHLPPTLHSKASVQLLSLPFTVQVSHPYKGERTHRFHQVHLCRLGYWWILPDLGEFDNCGSAKNDLSSYLFVTLPCAMDKRV